MGAFLPMLLGAALGMGKTALNPNQNGHWQDYLMNAGSGAAGGATGGMSGAVGSGMGGGGFLQNLFAQPQQPNGGMRMNPMGMSGQSNMLPQQPRYGGPF